MRRTIRIPLLAAALLSACGAPAPRPSVNPGVVPAPRIPAGAAASIVAIDAGRSQLTIRVYRAGPLARLGHNHVIVARNLAGQVSVGDDFSAATLVLSIPVADLLVDDSSARASAGADFAETVAEDARVGTRRNMLGAAVLDAERFPSITVASVGVRPADHSSHPSTNLPPQFSATLSVDVAGHRSIVEAPLTLEAVDGALIASGSAVLRQSEMGLAPFSILLGALQVQDEFSVEYRLVAAMPERNAAHGADVGRP